VELGNGGHPDIAAGPEGDVYAVWQDQFVNYTSGEVNSRHWDNGWESTEQLSDGNDESLKPSIAIDEEGTVHVAWHHSSGVSESGEIEYRYKPGEGSNWS